MQPLRCLILRRPALLAALLGWALLLRLLVPAGYMPVVAGGAVALRACSGAVSAEPAVHHGEHDEHGRGQTGDHPAGAQPCAFVGLGWSALGVVAAMVAGLVVGYGGLALLPRLRVPAPPRWAQFRPPPRAPPVPA